MPVCTAFGAEERIKDPVLDFWRDPRTSVGHFNDCRLRGFAVQLSLILVGAQGDSPVATQAFGGVAHEVDQYLFELLSIGEKMAGSARLAAQFDSLLLKLRAHQLLNFLKRVLGLEGNKLGLSRSGQLHKILNDLV